MVRHIKAKYCHILFVIELHRITFSWTISYILLQLLLLVLLRSLLGGVNNISLNTAANGGIKPPITLNYDDPARPKPKRRDISKMYLIRHFGAVALDIKAHSDGRSMAYRDRGRIMRQWATRGSKVNCEDGWSEGSMLQMKTSQLRVFLGKLNICIFFYCQLTSRMMVSISLYSTLGT